MTMPHAHRLRLLELKHTPAFVGDEASFEFVDLDAALQGQLAIDHEGTITARKGNTLALGNHTLKVKASNRQKCGNDKLYTDHQRKRKLLYVHTLRKQPGAAC